MDLFASKKEEISSPKQPKMEMCPATEIITCHRRLHSQNLSLTELLLTVYPTITSLIVSLLLQVWMSGENHSQEATIQSDIHYCAELILTSYAADIVR